MALATPTQLAGFLQKNLDTYSATQALDIASADFEAEADTKFASTSATYTTEGYGQDVITLPRQPVIAVQSVTVDGVVTTDYVRRGSSLYRIARWGGTSAYAAEVVITYTYGYTGTVPWDAQGAVLTRAAELYENPTRVQSESIDDYTVRYDPGVKVPGARDWRSVAASYRIGAVA